MSKEEWCWSWWRQRTNENKWENVDSLNFQINSLKTQISQLESAPNSDKNLLKEKREELAKLENKLKENKLKQNTQPENKTNLYLGLGCGIFGLGLIGILAWLIFRERSGK